MCVSCLRELLDDVDGVGQRRAVDGGDVGRLELREEVGQQQALALQNGSLLTECLFFPMFVPSLAW